MDSDKLNIPLKYWIIAGVVVVVLLSSTLGSIFENRSLKNDIKERDAKIEQINEDKKPLLESIKNDEKAIKARDSVILVLSQKQENLQATIKHLKNENYRIKRDYVNSSIDERVRIFAELATAKDSL